jgi:4-methyl-5(b-hydroxyethyl)-thiazole monophosphate biosynthesis
MILQESEKFQADMLVLPGGMPGAMGLANCQTLLSRIATENKKGTLIGAICAGPMALAKAGILQGKRATIYPGMEKELEGAIYCADKVCIDGNIITSQGLATVFLFAFALLQAFAGEEKVTAIKKGMLFHD